MKFAHLLEMNMVPEWRNQYIDYKRLDAALSKAIEQKDLRKHCEAGIDMYFHLIKTNQKFAEHFSKQCQIELDKVNSFHREKLHEMKGKHNNLQDQLEQVLASAIYKELQPQLDFRPNNSSAASPVSIKSASNSLARTWRKSQLNATTRNNLSRPSSPANIKRNSSINDLVSSMKGRMRRSLHCVSSNKFPINQRKPFKSQRNQSSSDLINVKHQYDLYQGRNNSLNSSSRNQNEHNNNNIDNNYSYYNDEITSICISPPGSSCPKQEDLGDINGTELSQDAIRSMARKLSASLSINSMLQVNSQSDHQAIATTTTTATTASTTATNTTVPSTNNANGTCNGNLFFDQLISNSPKLWNCARKSNSLISWSGSSTSLNVITTCPSPDLMPGNHLHLQQMTPNSNAQSRKQIIAFHKAKISNLKFAFQELYLNLVLFEQYTQLNYAAFEQILRKHDRMFASSLGRKFYQEHVQTAEFYNDLQIIDQLIESVEHIYTLNFEDGNRRRAIEKLSVPANVYKPSSPMLDFRVGFELGCSAILFIMVILIGLWREHSYDWRTVFRLYRSPLLLIIFLFQTGISLIIWNYYKINHVLIFELNPRNKLSFQHFLEFASLLAIIWSLSVLAFLFSEQLHIPPALCPLFVVLLVGIYLFNPMAFLHHKARFWLLRIMTRIFTAPFNGPVKFADFWIADQLVSIVPLFLDLEYLSCFYMSGDEVLSVTKLTSNHVKRCVSRDLQDLVIRTIVAALPAWFRCAQCLRRWHDENWLTFHLANAFKYGCMVITVILSSIAQYNTQGFELELMRCIWLAAAIFTSSLTAYWDIIYDFGLFNTYDTKDELKNNDINNNRTKFQSSDQEEKDFSAVIKVVVQSDNHSAMSNLHSNQIIDKRQKGKFSEKKGLSQKSQGPNLNTNDNNNNNANKASITSDAAYSDLFKKGTKGTKTYPFLRKQLVYPVWVYYFAIIENFILRFGWIFTISLTEFSGIEAGLVVSLLAPMEMFRRFVWNCIRLENEQLNNCGLFRAVRDIPIETVAPIDESQLDKVIMMMDSRDGPSMRNRIMKRRALRPDSVSFMILNPHEEILQSYPSTTTTISHD